MFFKKSSQLFGLDIGSSAVKLVQLRQVRGGYRLEKLGIKPMAPEMIVDGTVMDAGRVVEVVKELLKEQKIKLKDVALSISGHSVIVKKITLPNMTEDELEESIKWEAEQYIPFDVNDVNIDFHILGSAENPEGQPQMNVLLVAAKKDKLNEYTSLVTEAGLNPVVVDVDAFAVENMYGVNYGVQPSEVCVLVNIGASVMSLNILKGGMSAFTRDISLGGNRYTETIQKEMGVGFEEAERAKKQESVEGVDPEALNGIMNTVNGEVISEISRTMDYFRSSTGQEQIDKVVLCGGSAKVKNLSEQLAERAAVPVEVADPFKGIQADRKLFDPDYLKEVGPQAGVGVGLAVRYIGDR
jgi:type IV pilus assembly protein PilM